MAAAELEGSEVLDLCDRVIGEPGRRRHLFAWLRAPGAGAEEWLPVDAYYPAHRLVIVWRARDGERDPTYAELVPAHGLRLLEISPEELDRDPPETLRRMIAALGPVASPAPEPPAPRAAGQRGQARERPTGYGLGLGVGLVLALFIELYLGVARGALDHGHIVLAFALAIDACARTLGAVAARRAGSPEWAWGCVLIGSPLVALFWRSEEPGAEPAPLAGLLSLIAMLALVIAVLTG
jgi:hypothetical protein